MHRFVQIAVICSMFIGLAHPIASAEENALSAGEESSGDYSARMKWFTDARFGMFIHWGPVSLEGTEIGWSRGNPVPVAKYDGLYKEFNPAQFDAAEWVGIAKAAGMKYIVLTAKHHDGFCLWDTETTDYDIMSTPFGRDVIKELAAECKKQGIVFSTYYSILDWYNPDYDSGKTHGGPGYPLPEGQSPDMDRYIEYMKTHLRELIQNYGPLGIMWFDGEWEKPWTHEMGLDLYNYVRGLQPNIIINNRVDKGRFGMRGSTKIDRDYVGDYDTPEQNVGAFNDKRPWESCITICRQWAWKPDDQMKSLKECLQTLVSVAGGDGNLLLNVGPMPDGRIEPRQVERLKEMGQWMDKYGESIYGTRGGPFKPGKWGASTHKDGRVYVHVFEWPEEGLILPAIDGEIVSVTSLTGGNTTAKQTGKGLEIHVPPGDRNAIDTIVVLELN